MHAGMCSSQERSSLVAPSPCSCSRPLLLGQSPPTNPLQWRGRIPAWEQRPRPCTRAPRRRTQGWSKRPALYFPDNKPGPGGGVPAPRGWWPRGPTGQCCLLCTAKGLEAGGGASATCTHLCLSLRSILTLTPSRAQAGTLVHTHHLCLAHVEVLTHRLSSTYPPVHTPPCREYSAPPCCTCPWPYTLTPHHTCPNVLHSHTLALVSHTHT